MFLVHTNAHVLAHAACSGIERMMSESPMSVIESTDVRNIFPHAVPRVMLSAHRGGRGAM